ncbi:uncharacterized protein N7506_003506 [Penicillium brevicompactum]|uniref:uncharacterized protein n=1 Tax=Penicillium brevicompactum TaxID=5074 RepID=UPI002540A511|nr:uncharacterized protein N7506_003506 [Penicillium brevicompactum]KAJ5343682.1 hypothetical protein N7506_003506 [Penicillium brevicompactum]
MTKRLPLSCENCRRRKIRCLGSGVPCDTCRKRGVASSCQFKRDIEPNPQPRETNSDILLQRISDLESLLIRNIELTSNSSNHDHALRSPISQHDIPSSHDGPSQNPTSSYSDDHVFDNSDMGPESDEVGSIVTSSSGHVRYVPYSTSCDSDVFHSLQSRSQVESSSSVFLSTEGIPSTQVLIDMLPPFRHCDELITTFLNVFSPLFHILHDGTFQSNYAKFKQNPQSSPTSFIGLIFVCLGLAVTAIDKESPILADLGRGASTAESVKSLATKYREAAMRCLAADNFMWQHNLHTLQCLILLIYAINHAQGPAWALLGTTLNIAIAIGCHVDPALLNLPPVEIQERRRAWAGLMMLYTIQNTCLGNMAPFQVRSNVELPADVEDEEVVSDPFQHAVQEVESSPGPKKPTKMSYILFKFRLYSLASEICGLRVRDLTANLGKLYALDGKLQNEMQAQAMRFHQQLDLPTYHQAHSLILNNYTNHLVLLLHRICLLRPEGAEDGSLTTSSDKCEDAALAILSNYETLNMRADFTPYRWYINGLGSFHAFLAISILLVLLGKPRASQSRKHVILQAVQSCLRRLHETAPYSEICQRACSILDPLMTVELSPPAPPISVSDGVSNMGSTSGFGSVSDSMGVASIGFSIAPDPSFWELPESFEEIVAKIPCEQWLSPAVFPWADRCPI